MPSPTSSPAWMQTRALVLHEAFKTLAAEVHWEGANLAAGWSAISARVNGRDLGSGKSLRASPGMIRDNWYRWEAGGRSPSALVPNYKAGTRKLADELVSEWKRRVTASTGGRNKKGTTNVAAIYARLVQDWREGKAIPGLGTWQDWWTATHDMALPPVPPEFPHDERTMRRYCPPLALQKAGNVGFAAAKKHLPYVSLDYSKLRRCELFSFDDVRLDLIALDESTGRAITVGIYVAMEYASRSIPAFVMVPRERNNQADVDDLIVRTLQSPGYGIGDGYTTHLLFENGTVACSSDAQTKLEGFTDGGIKVHRNYMIQSLRFGGTTSDRAVGNSMGKGALEAVNGILHGLLLHLPGQRGNTRENQPLDLGIENAQTKSAATTNRNTVVAQAEALHAVRIAAMKAGHDVRVQLPILPFTVLRVEVEKAIALYNATPGRAFQGHGNRIECEIAPGVWVPAESPATES